MSGGDPAQHATHALALTDGYQRGLLVAAGLALANLAVSVLSPRVRPSAEVVAEALAAA